MKSFELINKKQSQTHNYSVKKNEVEPDNILVQQSLLKMVKRRELQLARRMKGWIGVESVRMIMTSDGEGRHSDLNWILNSNAKLTHVLLFEYKF